MSDSVRVAFVCVQNAGRSQMAAAFADRERESRGLDDAVAILTGGTRPAAPAAVTPGPPRVIQRPGWPSSATHIRFGSVWHHSMPPRVP